MSESDYEHLMRLKTMATRPELWRITDEATVACLRWALEQIENRKATISACCEQRYRDYKGPTVAKPSSLPPPPPRPVDLNSGSILTGEGIYEFQLTAEETAGEVVEVKIPDELLEGMRWIDAAEIEADWFDKQDD